MSNNLMGGPPGTWVYIVTKLSYAFFTCSSSSWLFCHVFLWLAPSSTYSAFHCMPIPRAVSVTGPVEIMQCLFDVELVTQSVSLFLTNQINRNLTVKLYRFLCIYTLHTLSVTEMTMSTISTNCRKKRFCSTSALWKNLSKSSDSYNSTGIIRRWPFYVRTWTGFWNYFGYLTCSF
jgi:hypothetical protein